MEFKSWRNLIKLVHVYVIMFYKDIENEFEYELILKVILLFIYSIQSNDIVLINLQQNVL